ncbi:MAG: RNA-binding S4 domain-containing protein [Microthrixaceae bacterium]|nr:RNA-binding S4 domain-containing protein [Microthrixaceae bacterium]
MSSSARVDQWLWAIRLYPTRSASSAACKGGHVRVNGRVAKPATPVNVGDKVRAFAAGVQREVEVVTPIVKRVGAPIAATCFIDFTPEPPPAESSGVFAERDRGAGRPTKRDRRQIDRLRGRRS